MSTMSNVSILNAPIPFGFPLALKKGYNLKAFWTFNIVLIIFLIGLSVFQVNSLTSEGYLVKNYEKQLNTLTAENKNLEIQFGKINSLGNIDGLVQNLNFEKVDKIYYIRILGGQVAKKYDIPATKDAETQIVGSARE